MRNEAEVLDPLSYLFVVVSFVETQSLRLIWRGRGPVKLQILDGRAYHLHVMSVGAVHCDRYRDTVRFRQQTAFDTAFAAIRRIGAGFFPHPVELWLSHRPSLTTTNRCHRAPVGPNARIPRTPRPAPTPGNVDGLNYSSKFRWRLTHSTGIPFGAQTRLRPWLHDRSPADCARPAGAAYAAVGAAPSVPTTHPANAIHRHFLPSP